MEEVAYEGQARGSRRVVLRAPPFEEISKEEKGDGPQQDSAGTENGPESSRQGAHRREHGGDLGSLFRGLIQRRSRRLSASKLPALPSFPACPRPRPAPPPLSNPHSAAPLPWPARLPRSLVCMTRLGSSSGRASCRASCRAPNPPPPGPLLPSAFSQPACRPPDACGRIPGRTARVSEKAWLQAFLLAS